MKIIVQKPVVDPLGARLTRGTTSDWISFFLILDDLTLFESEYLFD